LRDAGHRSCRQGPQFARLAIPQHGSAMPPTASTMGPRPMRIMSTIMVNEL
jgi:hypothetical protein